MPRDGGFPDKEKALRREGRALRECHRMSRGPVYAGPLRLDQNAIFRRPVIA